MEKIYLSIDLDFWSRWHPRIKENVDSMIKFFNKNIYNFQKLKHLAFVEDHHDLLQHVNDSECNTLVNMDYHSDISEDYFPLNFQSPSRRLLPELNCGTWVNWVEWRKRGKFIWVPPSYKCYSDDKYFYHYSGYCHSELNPFEYKKATQWRKLSIIEKYDINWNNVKAAGISVSFDWLHDESEYGIEYRFKTEIAPLLNFNYEDVTWPDKSMKHKKELLRT